MNRKILPPTSKRVQLRTDSSTNNEIRNKTINNINTYKDASVDIQNNRIWDLENEWDIERFLETNAASIILLTSMMGLKKSKCFLITGLVGFFLLQHALQGWCPPLECFRKMGIRTAEEIFNEKTALKMARGDFDQKPNDAAEILKTVEK